MQQTSFIYFEVYHLVRFCRFGLRTNGSEAQAVDIDKKGDKTKL
jgi:hypothetical protein